MGKKAAYRNEFDPDADFVPIELDGGVGTANGHLNEVLDNFSDENEAGPDSDPGDDALAPTVLLGPNAGLSLDDALLSGVLSGDAFLTDIPRLVFFKIWDSQPSTLERSPSQNRTAQCFLCC